MSGVEKFSIIGLGEVLWDLLPAGRQVGGAPANFAYHAGALGESGIIVSAVGNDALGAELLASLDARGLDRSAVEIDPLHPTGTVSVTLKPGGEPIYVIHQNAAWDFIAFTPSLRERIASADAICVGSLAQRSPVSRETIASCLDAARPGCLRVFDINLRQSYYDAGVIRGGLARCDVLKLNDEEWPIVAPMLDAPLELPAGLEAVRRRYHLKLIALTRGGRGSVLCSAEGISERPGVAVKVADTVGAGDAFTAAIVVGSLRGVSLDAMHAHAERVASFVCSQPGTTPILPPELRSPGRSATAI